MNEPSTLSEKALCALQEAVAKVVEEHRRSGRPIAVWRDGKAVWLHLDATAGVVNEPPVADNPNNREWRLEHCTHRTATRNKRLAGAGRPITVPTAEAMKTLVTVLAGAVLAGAAFGRDRQPGRALPDLPLRLESSYTDAAAAPAQIAATNAAPVVTMDPYLVKQSRLRSGLQPEIPRGAPGPTGNRVLDALQSGILTQHVGSKFTTELLAHGEPGPGGFAHLTFSYRISW